MKKSTFQIFTLTLLIAGILSAPVANCQQKSNINNVVYHIDARLAGKWMWTKASDGAYYKNNGVYGDRPMGLPYNIP